MSSINKELFNIKELFRWTLIFLLVLMYLVVQLFWFKMYDFGFKKLF